MSSLSKIRYVSIYRALKARDLCQIWVQRCKNHKKLSCIFWKYCNILILKFAIILFSSQFFLSVQQFLTSQLNKVWLRFSMVHFSLSYDKWLRYHPKDTFQWILQGYYFLFWILWMMMKMVHAQSCLFVTPWTAACQAPLFIGFSRQEYWSGLPFLASRDLTHPVAFCLSCLASRFFTTEPPGKPCLKEYIV